MDAPALRKDRRRDARAIVTRPVKVRCARTGKYYQGRTQDLSAGGLMMEIDHPALLASGQQVEVGVAWTSRNMFLRDADLIPCTVLRSAGMAGRQRIAVRFDQRQELAMAG